MSDVSVYIHSRIRKTSRTHQGNGHREGGAAKQQGQRVGGAAGIFLIVMHDLPYQVISYIPPQHFISMIVAYTYVNMVYRISSPHDITFSIILHITWASDIACLMHVRCTCRVIPSHSDAGIAGWFWGGGRIS
jgi:hypothetical protein